MKAEMMVVTIRRGIRDAGIHDPLLANLFLSVEFRASARSWPELPHIK
jgi:hypothetical protein